MNNIYKIMFLLLIGTKSIFAQDFSNYYSYLLNPVNINSALAGAEDKLDMSLNSRYMLTGIEGSPRNIAFNVHSAVKGNHGVGAKIISDSRGVFNTTRVDAMYAQGFDLNKDMNLRFGFTVGVLKRSINMSNYDANNSIYDASDPTISSNNFNDLKFAAGFGCNYTWKNLQVGFTSPQLIEGSNNISEHLLGSVSYNYLIADSKWGVKPMLYYQNYKNSPNVLDALVKTSYDDRFNVILGYSNNNRIKGGAGINLKTVGVNYLYEYATSNLNALSISTHEIMLNFSVLPKEKSALATEKELDALLNYITSVVKDDQQHSKSSLKKEIDKIQKQLDEIIKNNSDKDSEDVAKKLELIEAQIYALISKYNTK
jgi:type IX secretion system PorP/SprF family membrane protein